MPRQHKNVLGTQFRRNYAAENLERALEAVILDHLSFAQASARFSVPKSTLYDKYRGLHGDKLGRPPIFNVQEEKQIVSALEVAASFNFPLFFPQ